MSESTRAQTCRETEPGAGEAAQLAQHERLVHWVVRHQGLGPLSYVDAVHEGRIGLWQALRHYDPARGTTFSTYAVPAITRAVWSAVAREQRAALVGPAPTATYDGPELGERLDRQALAMAVRTAVAQLPRPLRAVVVAHAGLDGKEPATFAAIGARLGVSKQRVHQLYGQALERLAHPSASRTLRRLAERSTRADYRATLARQQRRARARRGHP
jgi:RNA polymerase sigma factor (sigma-70 family)